MLKAITLYQPYGSAVAELFKKWETRGRKTSWRGEIAIHAAKSMLWPMSERMREMFEDVFGEDPLPTGAIVCVADLTEVQPTETLIESIDTTELMFGDYSPGRFGWKMENVRKMAEPVPCRGYQSTPWTVPADVEARVREQLIPIAA